MPHDLWTSVDHYLTETLVAPDADPALASALADCNAAGLPPISVAPPQGKLLMMLARAIAARNILEIGTLGGYSAIWLASALPADGRLITLESDARNAEVARANIARARQGHLVEVRVGLALDTLPKIATEGRGPFDLFFIDADKPGNPEYFAWALRLARPGSLIIVDNVIRDGAVVDAASTDASVQGVRRLNAMIAAEPRVTATAMQTVGSKGYDGFAMALVVG